MANAKYKAQVSLPYVISFRSEFRSESFDRLAFDRVWRNLLAVGMTVHGVSVPDDFSGVTIEGEIVEDEQ